MSADLTNVINSFSANIRPDLVEALLNAVRASSDAGEFDRNPSLLSSFSQLIVLLASRRIPEAEAINMYMSNANTRNSASRPFFYHMTSPSFLYPEDNPMYPPAPFALPLLSEQPAQPSLPPQIILPADFFVAPPRIPEDDEAQAPRIVPLDYDDDNNNDEDDNNEMPNIAEDLEQPADEDDNEDDNNFPNDPMDVDEEYY